MLERGSQVVQTNPQRSAGASVALYKLFFFFGSQSLDSAGSGPSAVEPV